MPDVLRPVLFLLPFALAASCGDPVLTRLPAPGLLHEAPVRSGLAIEAPLDSPNGGRAMPQRLFISGHSLVDQPFPLQLSALALRAGTPMQWNRRYLVGSSIRERGPPQLPEGPYDALLITEQHGLLGSLMWNETERELRSWHEALREANPAGITYFYVPWLAISNLDDPRAWIAYEKAAALVWQCLATRINADIAAEGRDDRIVTLPASLALVHLVEEAINDRPMAGITASGPRATVERLVADGVHLTALGSFYIALVSYLDLSGMDPAALDPLLAEPMESWATPEQARSLLRVAADFQARRGAVHTALDPGGCLQFLEQSFIDDYWHYYRMAALQPEHGWLGAQWKTWLSKKQSRKYFLER